MVETYISEKNQMKQNQGQRVEKYRLDKVGLTQSTHSSGPLRWVGLFYAGLSHVRGGEQEWVY